MTKSTHETERSTAAANPASAASTGAAQASAASPSAIADPHRGHGGLYRKENGQRVLVERTAPTNPKVAAKGR